MRQLLVLGLVCMLAACSSGKSSSETGIGLELQGTWKGSFIFNPNGQKVKFSMNLRQVEDSTVITDGQYQFEGFRDSCLTAGPVSGNVVGGRIALTFGPDGANGAVTNLTGDVSNTQMSGIWSSTGGPCLSNNGTWSARKA